MTLGALFSTELRYALRRLVREPMHSLVTILTLGAGIGASTAVLSVVQTVILRPLPYPDSDRIVSIATVRKGVAGSTVSIPDARDFKSRASSLAALATVDAGQRMNVGGDEGPGSVVAARVSEGFFEVFATRPLLGRVFETAEFAAPFARGIVISHGIWQRRYGGDRAIVGRQVRINGIAREIVGVMPAQFAVPTAATDIWLPAPASGGNNENRFARLYLAYARLAPETTMDRAVQELSAVALQNAADFPASNSQTGVSVMRLQDRLVGNTARILWVALGAAAMVLAIACVNLVALALVRLTRRTDEIRIRLAHGATRAHLLALFASESLTLAAGGAAAGGAIAYLGVRLFVTATPATALARHHEVGLDAVALATGVVSSLLLALVIGGAPALLAGKQRQAPLTSGGRTTEGRGTRTLRRAFVLVEIVLAVMLVSATALLGTAYVTLLQTPVGIDPSNTVSLTLSPRGAAYRDPRRLVGVFEQVVDRVRALPGVTAAGAVDAAPLDDGGTGWTFTIEGQAPPAAGDEPRALVHEVTDGYLETVKIPLMAGRHIRRSDAADLSHPVVVSHSLSERFFSGQEAVGRRVKLGNAQSQNPWFTIVGVVGDVRTRRLADEGGPEIYVPLSASWPSDTLALIVRTAGAAPLSAIRRALHDIDPEMPAYDVRTLEEITHQSVAAEALTASLVGTFAGIALGLSALGLFGLLSQAVAAQERALAVRRALGAGSREMIRFVVAEGAGPIGGGLVLGLAGALIARRLIASLVHGVPLGHPSVFISVAGTLLLIAIVASLPPILRAMRIDPVEALRRE